MEEILTKEVMDRIRDKIGKAVQLQAKQLVPVDKGPLMASITYRIDGEDVVIFSNLPYAEDMEYGRPPGLLGEGDKEELLDWGKRHGLNQNQSKKVIKHIETKGIEVGTPTDPKHVTSLGRDSYRPFLRPALNQTMNSQNIKLIVMEAIQ